MNIIRIDKDNMLNGEGIRAVMWVAGCSHHCKNCHNPETWNPNTGHKFNNKDKKYLFELLNKDYIAGVTFTGGDPLFELNREEIFKLCKEIKLKYPKKNIWLYTGYTIEELKELGYNKKFLKEHIDVLVEGKYIEALKDINYQWAGSTNQRIIRFQ